MNTIRFNVFNLIHKGLRALLFDTVMQWQQTDMTDAEKAKPVVAQVVLLLELFDSHAHTEDNFIMTAVEQFDPALIHTFEAEHDTDLALSNNLRGKLTAYLHALDKLTFGFDVYYALNEFVAFNLKHMNREEQILNKVLWAHYTDAEIHGIEHRLKEAINPEKMNLYFEWMLKGMNDAELLDLLNAVKMAAPDFVLAGMLDSCAHFIPAERWSPIETLLLEGMAVV